MLNLRGLVVDLAVPLADTGQVLERLFSAHLQKMSRVSGICAVLVNGPTSESSGIESDDRRRLLEIAVGAAPRGFPVLAGIELDREQAAAQDVENATAAGVAGFYAYSRGHGALLDDVERLAAAIGGVPVPVVLSVDGSARGEADLPGAVKAAESIAAICVHAANVEDYQRAYGAMPSSATVLVESLTGHDVRSHLAVGGDGALIAAANIAPDNYGKFVAACLDQEWDRADELNRATIQPVAAGLESASASEQPVVAALKAALELRGFFTTANVRPWTPTLSVPEREHLHQSISDLDLSIG